MTPPLTRHREPMPSLRRSARALTSPLWGVALWGALLLGACGQPAEIQELQGPIGPGSGGTPVNPATVVVQPLASGTLPLGTLEYDSSYFTLTPLEGDTFMLSTATGETTLLVTPITGRPDTPCRYQAALLARDQGYEIQAAGDRTNSTGLDFHQVNLGPGGDYQRLYCTSLRNNVGVLLNASGATPSPLADVQMHFVLNSVTP